MDEIVEIPTGKKTAQEPAKAAKFTIFQMHLNAVF
jgi:hypothetical protein